MSSSGLPAFFRFNLWANMRTLDACAQLSDEQLDMSIAGTYGSIRDTLMHLFAAEEGYAVHFTGTPPDPRLRDLTTFAGFDELRRRAHMSGNELIAIAEHGDINQIFHLDDETYAVPAIIVLIQAINHGDDHRSQIATLLSQQGIEPPDIDAWSYNDAQH
jgi:uncharacterized damage-inducible protein DinB